MTFNGNWRGDGRWFLIVSEAQWSRLVEAVQPILFAKTKKRKKVKPIFAKGPSGLLAHRRKDVRCATSKPEPRTVQMHFNLWTSICALCVALFIRSCLFSLLRGTIYAAKTMASHWRLNGLLPNDWNVIRKQLTPKGCALRSINSAIYQTMANAWTRFCFVLTRSVAGQNHNSNIYPLFFRNIVSSMKAHGEHNICSAHNDIDNNCILLSCKSRK